MMMRTAFAVCVVLLCSLNLQAQEDSIVKREVPAVLSRLVDQLTNQKEQIDENLLNLEIDGIIVDETKTKAGSDFYDLFISNWEPPVNAKNYSLSITEKPYRLRMTVVEVSVNDNLVFNTVLQPRFDIIQIYAEQAIARCSSYLINMEEIERQMSSDDQQGSGIF